MELMENNKRMRINIGLTAKGKAQWDITAEYSNPEEAANNISEAIDKVRSVIKEKGLTEVNES